ncbi:hypothetical protein MMC14_002110 [Varicellaria rhodocarpa]|nr:hypothetical protein [Varicellaria rhodocarpa]
MEHEDIKPIIPRSIEINLTIIAACIPTFRPVYLIVFRRPGAKAFLTRKRSRPLQSVDREAAVDLDTLPTSQQTVAIDGGQDAQKDFCPPPNGTIRVTINVDVSFEHNGSMNPTRWSDLSGIIGHPSASR